MTAPPKPDVGWWCETCGLSDRTWRNTRTRAGWQPLPCIRCQDHFAEMEPAVREVVTSQIVTGHSNGRLRLVHDDASKAAAQRLSAKSPRCSVCDKPMVVGQAGMHYVCRDGGAA